MTSRDDATRAAVAPMLADLRSDLLVMPSEHIVEQHLDMMAFEAQVLATPRFVQQNVRRGMPHPRRAFIALVCACTTLVSCGLSAAGALPAPLQHITETIAHTFGVPHTDHASSTSNGKATGAPAAVRPAPSSTPSTPATAKAPAPSTGARTNVTPTTSTHASAPTTTTTVPVLPDPSTQIATQRPHVPPQRITPVDPNRPPSHNSSNAPPGFPSDWRAQAAVEAAVQLAWTCSQETTLTPTTCPQQATPLGTGGQAQSVQWTLWNNPFAGAAVVAKTTPGDPAKHTGPTTKITVYVAFQMSATYTETDGSGPYRSYSAGIGAATMTWDGSSFVDATFSPGSVAGHLLPGVKAPSIPRTANTGDGVVRSAVQSGLNACVAAAAAPDPVLICPQTTAVGEQWTLSGDPTLGATVAYDPTDGLFTVTGTYAMTSNLGNASSGPYTATLFFDGTQLQVLSIAAG